MMGSASLIQAFDVNGEKIYAIAFGSVGGALLVTTAILFGVDAKDNDYLPEGLLEKASRAEIQATVPGARESVIPSKESATLSTLSPWFVGKAGGVAYGLSF